jgi:hypothetical protein
VYLIKKLKESNITVEALDTFMKKVFVASRKLATTVNLNSPQK